MFFSPSTNAHLKYHLGAGSGLFTRKPIEKGSCVCIYTGKVLRTVEAIRREDKSYLMRLGPQVYVDPCDDYTVLGRYVNDPRNRLLHNVVFDKRPDEQCAHIVAKRDIAAGEEIFADYGRWYWLAKTPTKLERLLVWYHLTVCVSLSVHDIDSNKMIWYECVYTKDDRGKHVGRVSGVHWE